MKENIIVYVEKKSVGDELGLKAGDVLLAVNGRPVCDVFDYRYQIMEENFEITVRKANGEVVEYEIEKDIDEELGIVFDSGLMDKAQSCKNKCIFCFIDQLPPNMRETVYFKDDDSRLSFLQGNYVTLTNMTDNDIKRITKYHLSPINISVHTTNPSLRVKMLKNPHAADIMEKIMTLVAANITLNFQIVLCKGINDGDELDKSIADLVKLLPHANSLSVVPVGLTGYRNGLYPLEPYGKEDAACVLQQIRSWQKTIYEKHGTNFVYAADEFYLTAEEKLPSYREYDGFPQLENGVGMLALMRHEFMREWRKRELSLVEKNISIVTGEASYLFMRKICRKLKEKMPRVKFQVHLIKNYFFGGHVTVSGLLTGGDIIGQLEKKADSLGDMLLIPENALRDNDTVFLDDVDITDVETRLHVKVIACPCTGEAIFEVIEKSWPINEPVRRN